MAKVLIVTDYAGNLHITPLGNKGYYQSRNVLVTEKQFKLQEMEEDEAVEYVEKHKGTDPGFVKPADAGKLIADKDAEIAALRAKLEELGPKTDDKGKGTKGKGAKEELPPLPPAE